jgi:hypothetical protein
MNTETKEFILYLVNPQNPYLFLSDRTILNVDTEKEETLDQIYENWKNGRILDK